MAKVTRIFARGLLAIIPLFVCVYFIFWFFTSCEHVLHAVLTAVFPNLPYFSGLGTLLGLIFVFLFGLLLSSKRLRQVFETLEMPFNRVPLVKSIYSAVRDLLGFFNPGQRHSGKQVVRVKLPHLDIQWIGFVTNRNLKSLPAGIAKEGTVAVFIPLSYQIGGMTIFIPESWTHPMDMSVETAVRSALTAWVQDQSRGKHDSNV